MGMIALMVASEGEKLLHVADAISNPTFFQHPSWHNVYDSDPIQSVETHKKLIALAVSENALVYAYHISHPGLGRVLEAGENWAWETVGR